VDVALGGGFLCLLRSMLAVGKTHRVCVLLRLMLTQNRRLEI
jgi:hypothetical protein